MGVNIDSDFHQTLYRLGHSANKDEFDSNCKELQIKSEDVLGWLENNKHLVTKDDISSILHIKDRMVRFFKVQPESPTILKMNAICGPLLVAPAQESERWNQVNSLFANNSREEQECIGYLTERLSFKHFDQFLRIMKTIPVEDRFEIADQLIRVIGHLQEPHINFIDFVFNKIEAAQRVAVFTSISPYLSKSDPQELRQIIPVIEKLSKDEIVAVFQKSALLVEKANKVPYWLLTVEHMGRTKTDERNEVTDTVLMLIPYFKNLHNLLLFTSKLPKLERREIIDLLLPLIKEKTPSINEFENMAMSFVQFPKKEREDLVRALAPHLLDIKQNMKSHVINFVSLFPNTQRVELVEVAVSMGLFTFDRNLFFSLFDVINHISEEQRLEVIKKISSLIKNLKNKEEIQLISLLTAFPDEFKIAGTLIKRVPNFGINIIEALRKIPLEEREGLVNAVFPLVAGVTEGNAIDGNAIAGIITSLCSVEKEERMNFVTQAKSLLSFKEPDTWNLAAVRLLLSIPKEERKDFIEFARPFLQEMDSDNSKMQLLEELKAVGTNRADLCARIKALRKYIKSPDEIPRLIMRLNAIPLSDRDDVIHKTLPFYTSSAGIERDLSFGLTIAQLLLQVPTEMRSYFLEKAGPLIMQAEDTTLFELIFNIIKFVPPNFIDDVLLLLVQSKSELPEDFSKIVGFIFEKKPELIEPVQNHIFELLQASKNLQIADFVARNYELLKLTEQHPLFDLAIEVSVDAIGDQPRNPLVLYQKFRKDAQPQKLLFELPNEVVSEKSVSLNPETFQKKGKIKVTTFGQLPSGINHQTLTNHFKALEARIATLERTLQQKTKDSIEKRTLTKLEILKFNFVEDSYIEKLLSTKGAPNEPVSEEVARFFAIMKFIGDKTNELQPGRLLTPREEVLLAMATSIQNCPYGKSEGIALAYNLLTPEYKISGTQESAQAPEKEKTARYVDAIVQNALNDELSSDNLLMKEMTNNAPESIGQLAHHSLYLKNSLAPTIGLQHQIKYDPYSTLVAESLLARDRMENLKIFYKHFTPSSLIKSLLIDFNKDVSDERIVFGDLTRVQAFNAINDILSKKMPASEIWEITEDYSSFLLTKAGARELLLVLGYLQ